MHFCHYTTYSRWYVLPDTGECVPPQSSARQSTYPGGMEGWVDQVGWLDTKTLYMPTDIQWSRYKPGPA